MNNEWAFLPMRASNDLLGDPEAVRARMDEDSYLLFRGVIDPGRILAARLAVAEVLRRHGWILGGPSLLQAVAKGRPTEEGKDEYAAAYDDVQRLHEVHEMAHDAGLMDVMRQVVGDTAFPHPLAIARLMFPDHGRVTTPPHQDYLNNQGTPELTAAWVPLGDCPRELGSLAILRGSHRWGLLPRGWHDGPGNRQALLPPDMVEQCRWVATDMQAGDVLVFKAYTVHAALHNATEVEMRLSVDFRYQQEGEALTEVCLQPHFGRLTWEEIYEGWPSTEHQYYWRDLDYQVVPWMTEPEAVGIHDDASPEGWEDFDEAQWRTATREAMAPDDWKAILRAKRLEDRRYERRVERLRELGLDQDIDLRSRTPEPA